MLYTWAGPEIAVATTKGYTTQVCLLYLFALYAAKRLGRIDDKQYNSLLDTVLSLPKLIQKTLDMNPGIPKLAAQYHSHEAVFFIGRNTDCAVCLEGALKLKEISYLHAEAYAAGELKHGTIGDIEGQPFIEAVRQVSLEVGRENSLFIHVTLVPYLHGSEEHKSKPTQHSVKELQGMGVNPDIIVLRCDEPLERAIFDKIALFCNVRPDCVIENRTLSCLYEAPLMLERSGFSGVVCRELGIDAPEPDLCEWTQMVARIKDRRTQVEIGLVGKYVALHAKIEIVCREARLEALTRAMMDIGITGMTVSHVLGCGAQKGKPEYYRGVQVEATLLPKVQVDVVVSKVPVRQVLETAKKVLYTGHIGDGKIFVYDVENVVKVRTGEEGFDALQDVE